MTTKVTLQFQSSGAVLETGGPIHLVGESLTIGRSDENDLVLPDLDRMLSKRHCTIEDHNGNIIVVDRSTNGTFLNYGKLALGDSPTPLNDGDILSIGPYELIVSIVVGDAAPNVIASPLEDAPVSPGSASAAPSGEDFSDASGDSDFLDDLLGGRDEPVGPRGVDRAQEEGGGLLPPFGEEEDEILPPFGDEGNSIPDATGSYAGQGASVSEHTPSAQDSFVMPQAQQTPIGGIPDDWDNDLLASSGSGPSDPFGKSTDLAPAANATLILNDINNDFDIPAVKVGAAAEPAPSRSSAPVAAASRNPSLEPEIVAAPVPSPPSLTAEFSGDAAAREFLKALGTDGGAIPDVDLKSTLSRMGNAMRLMITGMREILMTRTSIKSEFRIEQTMIKVGGNNPLKFSISPEQAIEAMVQPSAKGYLDAEDAISEALRDIKAHEIAMVTGMEAALKGILAKLDPAVLEQTISVSSGLGSLLKGKKVRYWEVYQGMYAQISDQAENDFHELFAREFARAYQEQLDKLR